MRLRAFACILAVTAVPAASAATPALDRQFEQTVRPFVTKYCIGCHSGQMPAAQFDLDSYSTLNSVVRDNPRWALAAGRLTANEMPPAAMPQPPAELRQQVIEWIKAMRSEEARKNAGDPGIVLARLANFVEGHAATTPRIWARIPTRRSSRSGFPCITPRS